MSGNHRSSLAVAMISPYASARGPALSSARDSALNVYTRYLATALANLGVDVSVISATSVQGDRERWEDGPIEVIPSCVRGSYSGPVRAMISALSHRARIIHMQHELFAFGNIGTALLVPICLALLRLAGRKIVTTLHGVMPLDAIDKQFVKKNGILAPPVVVRAVWKALIKAIVHGSSTVHVHDIYLRGILEKQYAVSKEISVIPFGPLAEVGEALSIADARTALNIPDSAKTILFFGYLSAYKGFDYFLEEVTNALRVDQDRYVIIAGESPERLAGGEARDLQSRIPPELRARFRILGFVPEHSIPAVFCASDLIVLPYTVAMSASGPLSIAMSFNVPALLSRNIENLWPGVPGAFDLTPGALSATIERFFTDYKFREHLTSYFKYAARDRSWMNVASAIVRMYEAG